MTRIVRNHYPVDKLPEDLRKAVRPATSVNVTLVPDTSVRSMSEIRKSIVALRARPDFKPVDPQDAVDRIRALRDEWE